LLLGILILTPGFAQSVQWVIQDSGTQAGLRGVSVVNAQVVWASGSGGTWLRTVDGGATWHSGKVPGAEDLDFRGIQAFSAKSAVVMSAGPGEKSRIYKTSDAGAHWRLVFTNPDAKGFWDAIVFRGAKHGVLAGDAVDGAIAVFTSEDGGEHWTRRRMPAAKDGEGAFAASNTSLAMRGKTVWFGSSGARVFRSADGGVKWTVAATPVRKNSNSSGIFSVAFANDRDGVAVGGDYAKDAEPEHNIAVTADGGRTWTEPAGGPAGFRSAALWLPDVKSWVVTGTSGSDWGVGGKWTKFDSAAFNALGGKSSAAIWAVGPRGRVARLSVGQDAGRGARRGRGRPPHAF
jgi:photosystem II stability/assembly factor-like uncharacterized protein